MKFNKNIKAYILLVLAILMFSVNYGQELYFFNINSEGIYKIKLPEGISNKNVIVKSNKNTVLPFQIKNEVAFIYIPTKGNYQIHLSDKIEGKGYQIPKKHIISQRNHYKYSLPNTLNKEHWFYQVISERNPFSTTLKLGIPLVNKKEYIKLKLYNFKKSTEQIVVTINGKENYYSLQGNGDHNIQIPYQSINENIKIKVVSLFNEVGLESIVVKPYKDKKIIQKQNFEKYTFSKPFHFSDFKKDYNYFSLEGKKLKKLDQPSLVNTLFIQKKNITTYIENIKPAMYPNEQTNGGFIVLYHPKAFKKNDTTILKTLLKKINPKIPYYFVNVQQIYHKYSYSNPSSKAIKRYLHNEDPKYVLLLGDASEKEDTNDLIPTNYYIQDKDFTRVETDYSYTYLSDPSKPRFSIGRLPFKTSLDLKAYIKKVEFFLAKKTGNVYAIYDDVSVIKNVPQDIHYTNFKEQSTIKKYLGLETITPFLNAKKPSMFQFSGHASYTGWSDNNKVEISDMEDISDNNLFMVLDLSCWTGTFAYHKRNSFSENLLGLEKKGAVSIIAASGYTRIDNYNNITKFFIKNRGRTIGSTLTNMKKSLFAANKITLDDIHAFNLLGIPTLTY